jgi:hypothetical protein
MASLKLIIAAFSFVSLAAIASPRSMEPNDAKGTGSPQRSAPMSRDLQVATRARCALLAGPEYHECIYAVIMNRPMQGRTREMRSPG